MLRFLFNFLAVLWVGWPALVVGYVCAAAKSGYATGKFLYDRDEDAAIAKFTTKD